MKRVVFVDEKIVLPLADDAPIKYDLKLAVPLLATLSYKNISENVRLWMFANYFQLTCRKKLASKMRYNHLHIYDVYNPFIIRYYKAINRKYIKNNDIIQTIKNKIKEQHYIYVKLDRYYLPGFDEYMKTHIYHTECIYGYDVKNEELYIIGFLNLSKSKLKKTVIKFNDFYAAISSTLDFQKNIVITFDRVNTQQKLDFDYEFILDKLNWYLKSKLPFDYICETNKEKYTVFSWDFPINQLYGFKALEQLGDTIQFLVKRKQFSRARLMLQIILEFEILMKDRLEFMFNEDLLPSQTETLINEYKIVVSSYEFVRNLFIKYEIRKDENDLNKVLEYLNSIIKKEKDLLTKIINISKKENSIKRKKIFRNQLVKFKKFFYLYTIFPIFQITKSIYRVLFNNRM